MNLAGEQLVLDTNILVHLLRGKDAGQLIERHYRIAERSPRAVISTVVKGELKALAYKFQWGPKNHARLDEMIAALPSVDISPRPIIDSYASLDLLSHQSGFKMGKNDLWIAATTKVLGGVLLTTDGDFDHLNPTAIRVERISVESLKAGSIQTIK